MTLRRVLIALVLVNGFAAAAPGGLGPPAAAALPDVLWYQQCSNSEAGMLGSWGDGNYSAGIQCPTAATPPYRGLWLYSNGYTGGGTVAHWEADAPGNIGIVMAHAPEMATDFPSAFYGGFFYWAGGNSGWLGDSGGGAFSWPSASGWQSFGPSPYFGWELACNASTECATGGAWFDVYDLQLEALEYQTPAIVAGPYSSSSNLWFHSGEWIRGSFPIDMEAYDPSGVCDMRVWWNGQLVQDTGERTPNGGYWDQCDPNHVPNSAQDFFTGASINTATVAPQSATGVQLALQAHNASYNPSTGAPDWTSYVEYLNIDNTPVGLSLNGPTDASVNGGTQYVTATASAGPSGVGSIMCSLDGSPWHGEPLVGRGGRIANANVPVAGIGQHQLRCYATNNSADLNGYPASSALQTWSLHIGEPVTGGITFSKVTRHCKRERKRITTPARWVTIRRHHKWVKVRRRARSYRRWTEVCRTRARFKPAVSVAHDHATTVNGWFATADGQALSHVPVDIETALDNGSGPWSSLRVVTTSADGSWNATIPPGPSRLIRAVYGGGPLTEAASSGIVTEIAAAKIKTSITPHAVPWSGSIAIRGELIGGYVPPDGVALRLMIRYTGAPRPTYLLGFRTTAEGTFSISFTFGHGHGVARYPIWVALIGNESDYPYGGAYSKAVRVTFGR